MLPLENGVFLFTFIPWLLRIKSMVSSVPARQDTLAISVNQIQTSVLQTHA